jgi:hypothetical protein
VADRPDGPERDIDMADGVLAALDPVLADQPAPALAG